MRRIDEGSRIYRADAVRVSRASRHPRRESSLSEVGQNAPRPAETQWILPTLITVVAGEGCGRRRWRERPMVGEQPTGSRS